MVCPKCGKELREEAKFCTTCGASVKAGAPIDVASRDDFAKPTSESLSSEPISAEVTNSSTSESKTPQASQATGRESKHGTTTPASKKCHHNALYTIVAVVAVVFIGIGTAFAAGVFSNPSDFDPGEIGGNDGQETPAEPGASDGGNNGSGEHPSSSDSEISTDGSYTLDEALELGSLRRDSGGHQYFVMRGEDFRPFDLSFVSSFFEGSTMIGYPYDLFDFKEGSSAENAPTISLEQGDILVSMTGYDYGYFCTPVLKEGYHSVKPNGSLESTFSSLYTYDEINGTEIHDSPDEAEEVLAQVGIDYFHHTLCLSDSPTSFTVGYYERSQFKEETIDVSTPYMEVTDSSADEDWIDLPVEKTKNGYFIVDTSALPSGKYILKSTYQGWYEYIFFAVE